MAETESERHEGAITEPEEGQALRPSEGATDPPRAPAAGRSPTDAAAERHEGAITEPEEGAPLGPGAEPVRGPGTGP